MKHAMHWLVEVCDVVSTSMAKKSCGSEILDLIKAIQHDAREDLLQQTIAQAAHSIDAACASRDAEIKRLQEAVEAERKEVGLIMSEIYKAAERLGGGITLLGAIGSYNDTLPNDEILEMLIGYNDGRMLKST